MNDTATTITAREVTGTRRLAFLPALVGNRWMLKFEGRVYDLARSMCPAYNGGSWRYVTLSNGGGYMAPEIDGAPRPTCGTEPAEGKLRCSVASNYWDGDLSPEALGIVCTLRAASEIAFDAFHGHDDDGAEKLGDLFHNLRDFAGQHPEWRAIRGAID